MANNNKSQKCSCISFLFSGLHYKYIPFINDDRKWCLYCDFAVALALARAVNYTPSVTLQLVAPLTIVIYSCNMFIVQATKTSYKPVMIIIWQGSLTSKVSITLTSYNKTSCFEWIKFITEDYFTEHANITTKLKQKLYTKVIVLGFLERQRV